MATKPKGAKPKVTCPKCGKAFKRVDMHLPVCTAGDATAVKAPEPSLAPGTVIGVGTGNPQKVPWTRDKMEQMFSTVTLIDPPVSMPVTFQGVQYRINAHEDIDVPAPIAAIYRDGLRSRALPTIRPSAEGRQVPGRVYSQGVGLLESESEEV